MHSLLEGSQGCRAIQMRKRPFRFCADPAVRLSSRALHRALQLEEEANHFCISFAGFIRIVGPCCGSRISYALPSLSPFTSLLVRRLSTFFLLSLWKRREWLFLSYKDDGQWRPVHPSRPTSLIVCVARESSVWTDSSNLLPFVCLGYRTHSSHTNLLSKHLLHTNLLFFSVVPIFDPAAYHLLAEQNQ